MWETVHWNGFLAALESAFKGVFFRNRNVKVLTGSEHKSSRYVDDAFTFKKKYKMLRALCKANMLVGSFRRAIQLEVLKKCSGEAGIPQQKVDELQYVFI